MISDAHFTSKIEKLTLVSLSLLGELGEVNGIFVAHFDLFMFLS